MSVRYNYNQQVVPPAPFAHVSVGRPTEPSAHIADLPAQLDTGADMTVIPVSLVESLNLVQLDQTPIAGFGGHVTLAPTYLIGLRVSSFDTFVIRVIADRDEPFCPFGPRRLEPI